MLLLCTQSQHMVKLKARKHGVKRNTTVTSPLSVLWLLWLFPQGYEELLKLQSRDSTAMKSQGCFYILKIKRNVSSLRLASNPQLLGCLVKRCLDPVSCHKWSLTQSLPALHAAPSEKHLWTLFDKLIAKWAISWRGFRIASRKPGWLQKKNAYRCKAAARKGERTLVSVLLGGGGERKQAERWQ